MSNQGPKQPRKPHSLADHVFGALAGHVHDDDDDHDHDHDEMDDLLAPGTDEQVVLTSIGIDIGSSGTQIVFARLGLERAPGADTEAACTAAPLQDHPQRLAAGRRETIYQSPVALTPFGADDSIDEAALGRIIDDAFDRSGIHPDHIDCGVVILTGLARQSGNAEAIARRLAEDCGDIVSASAGHHMEARLAAHGSGAVDRSTATGRRFLNIDIGGATTKLAICEAGRVVATEALQIGGRLAAFDTGGHLTRLAPAGRIHAARLALDWQLGTRPAEPDVTRLAARMADDLVTALLARPLPEEIAALYVTEPLAALGAIDGIIVSGGVGEYVYGRETEQFGDLGLDLGHALAARIDAGALPWPLMPATQCIRATVLGASAYAVQLSGRTGWISSPAALLPRRNLQVIEPGYEIPASGPLDAEALGLAIHRHLEHFDIAANAPEDIVLALRWHGLPEYPRLRALADGLASGLAARTQLGRPAYVVVEGDIARSLGAILSEELQLAIEILVLDGIRLADFDYVDLGRIRLPSRTVPVTIKTLVFREEHVHKRNQRVNRD